MTQNIWNAAKAVLRGSFRIQSYLKKQKKNSYKQLNLMPKATRQIRIKKDNRRKEMQKSKMAV